LRTPIFDRPITCEREFSRCRVNSSRTMTDDLWRLIRRFAVRIGRDDIRMRFGGQLNTSDETTLRRFFGVGDASEVGWVVDLAGDMAGISHRARVSRSEAEVALLVRSDLKRRGVGTRLLQSAISNARSDGVRCLAGVILSENKGMIRIANKAGFLPAGIYGLSVRVEMTLSGLR